MSTAFTRQLGSQSGVQLNPLRDGSEIPAGDNADQVFGTMMRATRGRIDKPFAVDRGNVFKKLGKGEQIRVSALNEAFVHVVEALNNGAYEAVIQRLSTDAAAVKWAVLAVDGTTWAVQAAAPTADYLLAVQHLECHNDGIVIKYHADEKKIGGVAQANDKITLRIEDKDGVLLYEHTGSLNIEAVDDYGNPAYLPDVIAGQTDAVIVQVGVAGAEAVIATASNAYGYGTDGKEKWLTSGTLMCFDEGGTAYSTANYMDARLSMQRTPLNYAYISSAGTQSPAVLAQLAQLAFDTNRQLRFGVHGSLTPEAAIAFVEQLNLGSAPGAHLLHAFWAPLKSADPTGINPKGYFGTETLNIAYACRRNAQVNAKGFAPKNYPIAGRNWPVNRSRVTQTYQPSEQELSALAKAKINPVVFETYTGGGRYVYLDSLTCALVENSMIKLIAVADMSTSVDDAVTRAAKDNLQLPMAVAVKRTQDFLHTLFTDAEASGWLVPSADHAMNGAAWMYEVKPDEARPYDRMQVSYWLRYDGTNRQTFVTQTITR